MVASGTISYIVYNRDPICNNNDNFTLKIHTQANALLKLNKKQNINLHV